MGIGAPTSIRTTPGRTQNRPRGITSSVPLSATGTTGAWALMAITNPPFLNGSRSPVRARVPSGAIRNESPARSRSAAASTDAMALVRFPRSTGTKPTSRIARPSTGSFPISAL